MSDLITVAVYMDYPEALIARSLLEANDIGCVLMGEHQIAAQPYLMTALQGARLQVLREDLPLARELLLIPEPPKGRELCPSCTSDNVHRPINLWSTIWGLLVGTAVARPSNKRQCRSCGFRWRVPDETSAQ